MFKITMAIELDETGINEFLNKLHLKKGDEVKTITPSLPELLTTTPEKFSEKGRFSAKWEHKAMTLMDKFVQFRLSDITGRGKHSDYHLQELRNWLNTLPLKKHREDGGYKAGKPMVYTPFKEIEGKKISATEKAS